jgi:hypothetical protein
MTVAETARELKVGVMYVYTLIRGGLIAATKVDGVWDITPESVAERKETVARIDGVIRKPEVTP